MSVNQALGLFFAVVLAMTPSAFAEETEVSSDLLLYADTDHVLVASPQVGATHALDEDGGKVSAGVVVDAITAASIDVISNATARFSETRTEANLAISKSFRGYLPALGYRFSHEPDYQSHAASFSLDKDVAGPDATLAVRYGITRDTIGRTGTQRAAFEETLKTHAAEVGLTQVINPKTILRGVYSLTVQNGFMEKPYRTVPLFSAEGIAMAAADGVALNLNTLDGYRLPYKPGEQVPDSRFRHAVAARGIRYLDSIHASLRLDYRLYVDSWGVTGHTGELAIKRSLGESSLLSGWLRAHYQGPADFWQSIYTTSDGGIPALRTTDKSLSPYHQETLGARFEWEGESVRFYVQVAGMFTGFLDHVLIDRRYAFLSQLGVRWKF